MQDWDGSPFAGAMPELSGEAHATPVQALPDWSRTTAISPSF